jgi:hypothetical protein
MDMDDDLAASSANKANSQSPKELIHACCVQLYLQHGACHG